MINKDLISKSLDLAIIKCQPKFESMHTVKQIAKYFHFKYEGIVNEVSKDSEFYQLSRIGENIDGKVHIFTDPKNDNCQIYIYDDLIEKETGLLKSKWYEQEFQSQSQEMNEKEKIETINETTYPLKQFFKDYTDLPENIKSSIGLLSFDLIENGDVSGDTSYLDDGKCMIRMHQIGIEESGFGNMIMSNPRKTLFHEVGHSISHKLGYEDKSYWEENAFADTSFSYLATRKDYKKARSNDKKLTGDRYATEYGKSSKSFDEEQADITSAMLLKALSKNDTNFNNYRMTLSSASSSVLKDKDLISIDDFLERYPNRISALNKYMNLEL